MSGALVGKDEVAQGHPRRKVQDDFRGNRADLGPRREKVGGRSSGYWELRMCTLEAVRRDQ